MLTESRAVAALRVFLVVLFAVLVLFQVMSLPGQFAHMAEQDPEMAYLRWPMTAVTVFWVLCVQVVVVCTWKLLTLVTQDRIFSAGALPWVNAIVWAVAVGWVMLLGAFVCAYYFIIDEVSDDPVLPALLLVLLLVGAVVGLLMVIMRALLRQATTLRTDMEAVI